MKVIDNAEEQSSGQSPKNRVLDFFRSREERFRDVPDGELTLFIGTRYPEFLDDKDFSETFELTKASADPAVLKRKQAALAAEPTEPESTMEKARYSMASGAAEGVQNVVTAARTLADPGPLNQNRLGTQFRAHQKSIGDVRYMDPALMGGYEESGIDPVLVSIMSRMAGERETRRAELTEPYRKAEAYFGEKAQDAKTVAEHIPGNETVAELANTAGSVVAPAVASVIPGAAVAVSGAQSAGSTKRQAFEVYSRWGIPNEVAEKLSDEDAVQSGLMTGAITAATGKLLGAGIGGIGQVVKKVSNRAGSALEKWSGMIGQGVESALRPQQVQGVMGVAAKLSAEAFGEATEEGIDQLMQGAWAMRRYRPDLTWEQALNEAGKAAVYGGILGGAAKAPLAITSAVQNREARPAQPPIQPVPTVEEEHLPLTSELVGSMEKAAAASRVDRITTLPEVQPEIEPAQVPALGSAAGGATIANAQSQETERPAEAAPVAVTASQASDLPVAVSAPAVAAPAATVAAEASGSTPAGPAAEISGVDASTAEMPAAKPTARVEEGQPGPGTVQQAPIPDRFDTVEDLLNFREVRRQEEIDLYQKEIGLNREEAERLQSIMSRNGSTAALEKKIGPEKAARLDDFFENSAYNQKGGPFQFWEFDRNYDPEELLAETDKNFLADRLVRSLQREPEQSVTNDRFLFSAIALRRFQEMGGTQSDLARAIDRYTTKNSGSVGDKLEFFESIARKVGDFARAQAVDLTSGDAPLTTTGQIEASQAKALPASVSQDVAPMPQAEEMSSDQSGGNPSVFSMATATPSTPSPAPKSPATKPAPLPKPSKVPAPPRGSRWPGASNLVNAFKTLRKAVAPQTQDEDARIFSLILREYNAQAALDLGRADEVLADYRKVFDRTPVPKDWVYDPSQPLPHNYAVIDALERDRASLPAEYQVMAQRFDDEFAWRIKEVRKLSPKSLRQLITHYFPHMWQEPEKGAATFMAEVAARTPFHGSKAFLKQRSIDFFLEGLSRGLKPISDNPVDLLLAKMAQMDKFIKAQRTLLEAKASGMYKYLPLGREMPDGWVTVKDPAFTVFAPPVMTVHEAFDAGIRRGLMDFIVKMGFKHERVAKLGVNEWGQYTNGKGEIKSRFGSPDFVIMHEIGHGLDERYGLYRRLASTAAMKSELKALADERANGATATTKFKNYIQKPQEQVANVLHAYLYAPELMDKVAPNVKKAFENFISAHPELEDLNHIKPSLTMATGQSDFPLAGPVLSGHWIMPEGPAQVLSNHLSPGLQRFMAFRTLRTMGNILNAAQLGFSAFHLGFTSLDASVSSAAVGLQYLLHGEVKKGLGRIAAAPVVPALNYYIGKAIQSKMMNPGAKGVRAFDFPSVGISGAKINLSMKDEAMLDTIAKMAVKGGLRATVDPFWQTTITRNFLRAIREGGAMNYGKAALKLPFAFLEQSMRPIGEYLVPRQKLGVFAQLAQFELERLGPGADVNEIRDAMAKAADSTEDRMGQMTYDNLYYQRWIKDLALLGFRAYGWQLGKYRAAAGAITDTVKFTMGKGEVTNRMLYPVALVMVTAAIGAIVQYLATGEPPEELMDYFFPKSGVKDANGKEQRYALPSYLKDLVGEAKTLKDPTKIGEVLYHKANPLISVVAEMLQNRDFYNTEIRHPDDPLFEQMKDEVEHLAKALVPFSVSGYNKLAEDNAPQIQRLLPFIGIVPAKKSITMTPAELKSAEIMHDIMPVGARTKEQFEKSQLKTRLVKSIQENTEHGMEQVRLAVETGILRQQDAQQILSRKDLTPLQYQVKRMPLEKAMQVWDLANPQERESLRPILIPKVANSTTSTITPEKKQAYLHLLNKR